MRTTGNIDAVFFPPPFQRRFQTPVSVDALAQKPISILLSSAVYATVVPTKMKPVVTAFAGMVPLLVTKPTGLVDLGTMYILDPVMLDVVLELMVHAEVETAVSVLTAAD